MAKEEMQIDLFGHEIPVSEAQNRKKTGRRETIKDCFRKMYGFKEGHTCDECRYLKRYRYGSGIYNKCQKIGITNSPATDIRLKDTACRLFEASDEHV